MYSIRYLIKKEGSQIAFWNHNASHDLVKALEIAFKFGTDHNNTVMTNSGWIKEDKDLYRMKIVYALTHPEDTTNFALHITVSLASETHKSNF
jgi:RecJ-like exonuclease